eukprot:CAMPEP_0177368842 /NCGR_PEP_ID=MMETSP0368-20130122/41146_1 /TAXON_ID=447022 ORGANISM="Scrippsiella hangoei-like, Strain SHHI-4" /NCGR_SAMPLE_ID=MMETSP0368 /ASSEMBLY_ACC=CAM_ASM_000363 /LENGTH=86 /DNA_ID=CAMNT_0018832011 /DNA_START=99 /DNA_END=355 /DNA_ORIENTATION=+
MPSRRRLRSDAAEMRRRLGPPEGHRCRPLQCDHVDHQGLGQEPQIQHESRHEQQKVQCGSLPPDAEAEHLGPGQKQHARKLLEHFG